MTDWVEKVRGGEALAHLLCMDDVRTVLDIGSGAGDHTRIMRAHDREVTAISLCEPADYIGDFLTWPSSAKFDAVWACHVLEHQVNPGVFLQACRERLNEGGILAVTVPPAKHNIVGGHVTLWNAGLLLYHLILAGFDCRNAQVGSYGYNISVLVRKSNIELPRLDNDNGDINRLAQWFPLPVSEAFDGQLPDIGWNLD